MIAPQQVDELEMGRATDELVLVDLLHDFGELAQLLAVELERAHWLDAFLLAAGMNQLTEDYMHRDLGSLARVAASLSLGGGLRASLAAPVRKVRRLAMRVRDLGPVAGSVASWQAELDELILGLARKVAMPSESRLDADSDLAWGVLLARARALPEMLRSEVLRLPSCFRSLDLQPEDMEKLAAGFAARQPDRARPLLVIGIRTSGSYLAPLLAAYLLQVGFSRVGVRTLRPGDELLGGERRDLRRAAAAGSLAVVVDDPPSSGKAVARTATLLQRAGFPAASVVLTLPLMTRGAAPPEALAGLDTIVLRRDEWAIETRLDPAEVQSAWRRMLGTPHVERVRRLPVSEIEDPWEEAVDRRHVRAVYEIDVRLPDGRSATRRVYAKGVGLGYFGRHSLAIAERLHDYLPELYGFRDGLLFRAWQPDAWRAGPGNSPADMAERIAGYVNARRRALPVERDPTPRMVGRQAVWQRTADLLLEPLGRLRLPLRPFVHRLAKQLLRVEAPSVVDGSMGLQHWFASPVSGSVAVKVDSDERAFSNEDIYSYDAAYDLGSAASSLRAQVGANAAANLRAAYESVAGKVDDERWFLYQLLGSRLHRGTLRSHVHSDRSEEQFELIALLDRVESSLEDAQREYMRACFLSDVGLRQDGPLCAIDIDGTLETAPLGFTAIGPAGAIALRALARHGFRAVLASGRSLDEVRVRCESYSLSAGVAEYGAVVYDGLKREAVDLLTDRDRLNLDRVRSVLASVPGVHLDGRYLRSIRAFTLDKRGRRRGITPETAEFALAELERWAVVAIPGWSQTDFVSASVNKADGLRVAAARLASTSRPNLVELAVGDALTDIPMFGVAGIACAPANGDARLRSYGIAFMRGSGQDGVAEAVRSLIGHRPGNCAECRVPHQRIKAGLLLSLMSVYERRGWGRLAGALPLVWNLRGEL